MHIFKFGGASIKTANAVRNIFEIVCNENNYPLVVIVSAMGKTTNALEEILALKLSGSNYTTPLKSLEKYHLEICDELFDNVSEIRNGCKDLFNSLKVIIKKTDKGKMEWSYDQVVSFGERFSSYIVSEFLNAKGIRCEQLDAPEIIKTSDDFKEAHIDWKKTTDNIQSSISSLNDAEVILSQGFIGSDGEGNITTLGREGSDFTTAVFANCLNAKSVTFWKDVPGIMNADPKIIEDAVLMPELSYQEAAEMTYYGAKVIHPKTIRPLANKNIPLYVRSFNDPNQYGTIIHDCTTSREVPVVVYKKDQSLFSFGFTDFHFVNEKSLQEIYDVLDELDIKVNLMQNSAISFSVCVDHHEEKNAKLIRILRDRFAIHYNMGLTLITIKNYTQEAIEKYAPKNPIMLEQKSRANYQAVYK